MNDPKKTKTGSTPSGAGAAEPSEIKGKAAMSETADLLSANGATTKPSMSAGEGAAVEAPAKPTVAHMLGELVWILSQSPTHKHFSISDLEWLVMPAILAGAVSGVPQRNTALGICSVGVFVRRCGKKND